MQFNVLRTESKAGLAKLLADTTQEFEPIDFILRQYVEDFVSYTWDILRYRRVKTGIFDNALRKALGPILYEILLPPSTTKIFERWMASQRLSYWWLFETESKRQVSTLLEEAGLDETAIEAKAYTLVADDLENVDRRLKFAEEGRDKALRNIAKYRKSFAVKLRRNSDRVLAADEVPLIADGEEN